MRRDKRKIEQRKGKRRVRNEERNQYESEKQHKTNSDSGSDTS
jgi:hypothetical protein